MCRYIFGALCQVFIALVGTGLPGLQAQQIYDEFIRGLPAGPDEGLLPKDAICQEPFGCHMSILG